jgi:hypothetical protein
MDWRVSAENKEVFLFVETNFEAFRLVFEALTAFSHHLKLFADLKVLTARKVQLCSVKSF